MRPASTRTPPQSTHATAAIKGSPNRANMPNNSPDKANRGPRKIWASSNAIIAPTRQIIAAATAAVEAAHPPIKPATGTTTSPTASTGSTSRPARKIRLLRDSFTRNISVVTCAALGSTLPIEADAACQRRSRAACRESKRSVAFRATNPDHIHPWRAATFPIRWSSIARSTRPAGPTANGHRVFDSMASLRFLRNA